MDHPAGPVKRRAVLDTGLVTSGFGDVDALAGDGSGAGDCPDCWIPHRVDDIAVETAEPTRVAGVVTLNRPCAEQTFHVVVFVDDEAVLERPVTFDCRSTARVAFDHDPDDRLASGSHEVTVEIAGRPPHELNGKYRRARTRFEILR